MDDVCRLEAVYCDADWSQNAYVLAFRPIDASPSA